MVSKQLDPAPEPKAGSSEGGKVWASDKHAFQSADECVSKGEHDAPFDEKDMVTAVSVAKGQSHHVPPSFRERECFRDLEQAGLAKLPEAPGFVLAYHTTTQQWHARWQNTEGTKNYAPSWGASRGELKALCLALCQLWQWYVDSHDDSSGIEHLNSLKSFMDGLKF